jgi:hypothetical protein
MVAHGIIVIAHTHTHAHTHIYIYIYIVARMATIDGVCIGNRIYCTLTLNYN